MTVFVPTRLAITPPRSMSPTSTTGTSAARAKPILAMSLARRFVSAALPAPSTTTMSASTRSRSKLSSTAGIRLFLISWNSRALALPVTLPWTTIWAPTSLWGFKRTGFMWTVGATPQALACKAWALPISPPSAVTMALFDMFCGLKGRTVRPRRVRARAMPAVSSDLPTLEPVPWNMTARAPALLRPLAVPSPSMIRLTPISARNNQNPTVLPSGR